MERFIKLKRSSNRILGNFKLSKKLLTHFDILSKNKIYMEMFDGFISDNKPKNTLFLTKLLKNAQILNKNKNMLGNTNGKKRICHMYK